MAIFGAAAGVLRNVARGAGPISVGAVAALGYAQDRERGINPVYSAVHSVASAVLFNEFMLPSIALSLAPLAPILHQKMTDLTAARQKSMLPWTPYRFQDSEQGQTSRARALGAIQTSRMNARNYIGNEGGLFASRFR